MIVGWVEPDLTTRHVCSPNRPVDRSDSRHGPHCSRDHILYPYEVVKDRLNTPKTPAASVAVSNSAMAYADASASRGARYMIRVQFSHVMISSPFLTLSWTCGRSCMLHALQDPLTTSATAIPSRLR